MAWWCLANVPQKSSRERLRKGELGVDFYRLRETLKQLGKPKAANAPKYRSVAVTPQFGQACALLCREREVGRLTRRAGQFDDMHPGVGAIDRVDVAAVVHIHVVGLNR